MEMQSDCVRTECAFSSWSAHLARSGLVTEPTTGRMSLTVTADAISASSSVASVGAIRCTEVEIVGGRRSSRSHVLHRSN